MTFWIWSDHFNYFFLVRRTAASLIRAVQRPNPQSKRRARIRERSDRYSSIYKYIHIYIFIYIYFYIYTKIPVATLPDSSPSLALRGGSAYGPYEWCRCSSHKKILKWSDQIQNFKTCKTYIELLNYQVLWPWVFYIGRDCQNCHLAPSPVWLINICCDYLQIATKCSSYICLYIV